MVTFALPGDGDAAAPSNGTPRSRPPLPFAKRAYAASPFGGSAQRLGTPQGASARKLLMRDDQAPSSLTKSNLASARNIFRASTISDSPPAAAFSPRIPASTPKKVFAPGATPEPSRFRGSTAQATPRGVAATAKDKDLFPMRIASPPKELTGETLARKVPKEWNPKGSIYADQFLADLCPPDFDEEQRRQFFCILDLRRLKYAADEIFARKGWKLNVINFAKEFEKSRSIILLRYGLYEFQNVKPSKEVLKRWRREHGLPEPEEEEDDDATPSKPINKKRKANDDTASVASTSKTRKVFEKDDEDEDAAPKAVPVPAPEPAQNKTKRKASVSDESEAQPFKMSKPSSASSLFQKIANKSTAPAPAPTAEPQSTTPKFNPFASTKPSGSSLAKSVFSNLKAGAEKAPPNGNIFGHLSDSSAKNSGAEADEESDPESEPEDSPEAAPSDGPSLAASGIADNGSQAGSSLFAPKSNLGSGFATAGSSAPGTRESTPGRSLFDRVTKNNEGQPLRSEDDAEASSTPKPSNQTWNPSTTPIKFAPPSTEANGPAKSLFGQSSTSGSGLSFPPKTSTTSSLFGNGSAQSDSDLEKTKPASSEQDKAGGESDKENDSQPAKSIFGAKPSVPQSTAGSLFQTQPAATEAQKAVEAPSPATNLFGGPSKSAEQSATPTAQSSTLFGAKPTEAAPEATKPTSLFGAPATNASTTAGTSSLFGAKPAPSTSNIFGNTSLTPSTNIFGAAKPAGDTPQEKPAEEKSSQPAPTPTFSFGSASSDKPNGLSQSKPLFGAPKSPPSSAPANSMFAGSPMKQDEASPAKKAFPGSSNLGSAPALFSSNLFGGASTPAANSSPAASFGGANPGSDKPANTGFSFTSNASAGSSFNNPFAAGGNADNSTPSFNFGASSTPAAGGSSFQFGASSGPPSQSGSAIFGGQAPEAPKPMFGGNTAAAPVFSFGSNSSQPPANNGLSFGSTQANAPQGFAASLQPPTGGASTTGTNSPMFSLGGGSSLGTTPAGGATPAGGTPEPTAEKTNGTASSAPADTEEGEKHEQINLIDQVDDGEEVLHDVRAKVLKFVPADKLEGDEKAKSKSPWSTQGVGPLRLLKNKETGMVRLLLRAEPRGHVALNRALLPNMEYKSQEKYVKVTTSNEKGDGLEMWMIQTKTKDLAEALAGAMEEHKNVAEK